MELKPGTYLQGDKYRIERTLGQGGFGITYLAEHEMAGRMVCIKEFFPKTFYNRNTDSCGVSLGSTGSAEMMEAYKQKFLKEAKTIARLKHPNIISIFDVFQENGTAYYVMEYIEGRSLSDVVRAEGALAESRAVDYIKVVASALGYIHDLGVLHLDIKPGNIMLRNSDNTPVLIDFGLSKQYDEEGNQTSSTPVGISHGFAPIEQYQSGGVSAFSPETDIYSLGATLYYLVTGKVPPQAAMIADEGLPAPPTAISEGVRTAIERAMEFRRKQRPHSMSDFVALFDGGSKPIVDDELIVEDDEPIIEDDDATQVDVKADDSTVLDESASKSHDSEPAVYSEPVVDSEPIKAEPKPKSVPESKTQSNSEQSKLNGIVNTLDKMTRSADGDAEKTLRLRILTIAGVVLALVFMGFLFAPWVDYWLGYYTPYYWEEHDWSSGVYYFTGWIAFVGAIIYGVSMFFKLYHLALVLGAATMSISIIQLIILRFNPLDNVDRMARSFDSLFNYGICYGAYICILVNIVMIICAVYAKKWKKQNLI